MNQLKYCLIIVVALVLLPNRARADLSCPSSSSSTLEVNGLTPGNANTVYLGRIEICIFGCATFLAVVEDTGGGSCAIRLVKYHGTSTWLTQLTKSSNICWGAGADTIWFDKPTCNNVDVSSFSPWSYNGYSMYHYLEGGADVVQDYSSGTDTFFGGTEVDQMYIGSGTNNSLFGESGDDFIVSAAFTSTSSVLQGGYGDDTVYNNSYQGNSYGYFGDDEVDGFLDPNVVDGGEGDENEGGDICCPWAESVWCEIDPGC